MSLLSLLLDQGLVTGPLPPSANTSNSTMGACKTFLLGQEQFAGDEKYLIFGRVLHEHLKFIEDVLYRHEDFVNLTEVEQTWLLGCCKAARENSIVKRLLIKSVREKKLYTEIDGVRLAFILDVEQEHLGTGMDWKSSSCKTLNDFVKKALLYDYIRQGLLYKKSRNLKHFYFIGLQKHPPHQVYLMDVKQHEGEELYAAQELKFLLYFFKHYGKILFGDKKSPSSTNLNTYETKQLNNMAIETKGKEALKAITDHYKKVKASHKQYVKDVNTFNKLVTRFPKKELGMYQEKLNKLSLPA